jgi:hypothetical protein
MQTFEKMVEKRDFINNCMVLVHGIEFGIGTHFNRAMEEDVVALSAHVERKALSSAQQVQMPSSRPVTQATSCAKDKPDRMHLARTAQCFPGNQRVREARASLTARGAPQGPVILLDSSSVAAASPPPAEAEAVVLAAEKKGAIQLSRRGWGGREKQARASPSLAPSRRPRAPCAYRQTPRATRTARCRGPAASRASQRGAGSARCRPAIRRYPSYRAVAASSTGFGPLTGCRVRTGGGRAEAIRACTCRIDPS